MIVRRLRAKNWRNFQTIDVQLQERSFIIGANAVGKSNFLDIFRFLRDIAATDGGGLQRAVGQRGGISKLRSLAARRDPEVSIKVELAEDSNATESQWTYALGLRQEARGKRLPYISYEKAWDGQRLVLDRPNKDDKEDPERLTQTFLEQINSNAEFREVAEFLQSVTYLHLVPQLLRFADSIQGRIIENDPFGQGFLERIAKTPESTRRSRLRKIERALKIAVPQLQQLEFVRDEATGRPHLQALYSHWRPNAGWQQEDQFSDGTLRLLALLWSLLEGDSMLLMEEPELNLNAGIVAQLPTLIFRMQRSTRRRRQVLISTHSEQLLTDGGIDGREVLILLPLKEGTKIQLAADLTDVRTMLESGFSVGEVVLPRTRPTDADQLSLL